VPVAEATRSGVDAGGLRYGAQRLGLLLLFACLLFASAGTLEWRRGWGYLLAGLDAVRCTGPYRLVRHPGYLGAILGALATPLMLGSLWTFVPAAIVAALFAVRTHLEDQTLRRELQGYERYAQRTRFRLVPWVW